MKMYIGSVQAHEALLQRAASCAGGALIYEDFSTTSASKWKLLRVRFKYVLRQLGIIG